MGQHRDAAAHVVQLIEQHVVSCRCCAEPGKRRPLGRLEQNIELSGPLEVRLEIRRDQGAGGIRLAIDRPVEAQMHQEPLAMKGGPGIVGLLDLDQLAVASQEVFRGPEGRRADDDIALEAGREVSEGGDAHVGRLALRRP